MDTLHEAKRAITSKPVQRAVVNTVLIGISAMTLLGVASISCALFFQNYVPDQAFKTPVHLQYGSAQNPYGVASLSSPAMKAAQDYDISVELTMPRSPPNLEHGNFMIRLHLLDMDVKPGLMEASRAFAENHDAFEGYQIIFSSRRPVLVPYVDPVVSLASRLLFLPYHLLVHSSQTTSVVVSLAERVSFPKNTVPPSSAYLEIEAGQTIETYQVSLRLSAQLSGLRWLMFHYRLPTYVTFTFLFWICELLFMGGVWTLWTLATPSSDGSVFVKPGRRGYAVGEADTFSDDDQTRLSPKREMQIKEELEQTRSLSELPVVGAEADDEDDGDDGEETHGSLNRDSGIGTSYSEDGSGRVRRRTGRM